MSTFVRRGLSMSADNTLTKFGNILRWYFSILAQNIALALLRGSAELISALPRIYSRTSE